MTLKEKVAKLVELAENVGLKVRYEKLVNNPGGLCRLHDELLLIINKNLSDQQKIELLVDELSKFPIDQHYMRPQIRNLFRKAGE